MTAHNKRYSREHRMSVDSSMTFESLAREKLYNGEDLIDSFQKPKNNSKSGHDATMSFIPPVQFVKQAKRPSAMEFEQSSGEFFCGNDLVDVFKQQSVHDRRESLISLLGNERRESLMSLDGNDLIDVFKQQSDHARRLSTLSLMSIGNDRRCSLVSLMSFADCSIADTTEIERENTVAPTPTMNHLPAQKDKEVKPDVNNNKSNNTDDCNSDSDVEKVKGEYIEELGPYDIICGRNNGAHNYVGNRRFRITIMMNLKRYSEAPNREEKTVVIKSVIDLLSNTEGAGARFIKKVGDSIYVRLNDKQIREKVGHAFRDLMSLAEQAEGMLEAKIYQ